MKDDFDKQKIIWPDISKDSSYIFDNKGFLVSNTAYLLVGDKLNQITLWLNSKELEWYYSVISSTLGNQSNRHFRQFVEKIPLPANLSLSNPYDFSVEELEYISTSLIPFEEI